MNTKEGKKELPFSTKERKKVLTPPDCVGNVLQMLHSLPAVTNLRLGHC